MDPRRVLATLWRRKWWIVAAVDIAVALSLFTTLRAPEQYRATAVARYADPSSVSVFGSLGGGSSANNPERQAAAEEIAAGSVRVLSLVNERLGPRLAQVRSLDASSSDQAQVLTFSATSTDPAVARDAATEHATAYVEIRRESVETAITAKAAELRRFASENATKIADLGVRLAELDGQIAAAAAQTNDPTAKARQATLSSQRALLQSQRESMTRSAEQSQTRADQLDIEATVQASASAELVQRATLPQEPFAPTPLQDAIVAALVGLLAGLGLALGREYFDDRIHHADDIANAVPGLSVLGAVPVLRTPANRQGVVVLEDPHSVEAEAYRTLRTSVQFRALREPLKVILVSSPMQAEGKTTTAANLAASLAANGARVAIADFDLRKPRLCAAFHVEHPVGLTDVLLGRTHLADALHEVPVPSGGQLMVLPPGALPPNPAELLGTTSVRDLVAELRESFDYVVLDSPPILPITDALVASQWADGVVLVTRVGTSRRRQIVEASRRLAEAGLPQVGLVINAATRERRYYSARYYGSYAATPSTNPEWSEAVAVPRAPASEADGPAGDDVPSSTSPAEARNGTADRGAMSAQPPAMPAPADVLAPPAREAEAAPPPPPSPEDREFVALLEQELRQRTGDADER